MTAKSTDGAFSEQTLSALEQPGIVEDVNAAFVALLAAALEAGPTGSTVLGQSPRRVQYPVVVVVDKEYELIF